MTNSLRERFWALRWAGPGDKRALDEFSVIADSWRNQGYHLGAAAAMESAAMAAWGDPDQMRSCVGAAMEDYDCCLKARDPCSLEGFIALKKSAQLRRAPYGLFVELAAPRQNADEILQVLADRLVACGEGSEHAESYLVRGLIVETNFEEHFVASYPDYDVDWDTETAGSGLAQIRIPSTFQLFVSFGDYLGAHRIAARFPGAFSTPALQGWKAAVRGLAEPEGAAENFHAAAQAFAQDRRPAHGDPRYAGRSWSSINVDLWSPYFESRSALSKAIREPERVRHFVDEARDAAPEIRSGWHHPTVARYVVLVRALAGLLRDGSPEGLRQARESFTAEQRLTGEQPGDQLISRFLAIASEAFEGFQADPGQEITSGRLRDALHILGRIPIVEPGFADAVRPALGTQALDTVFGPVRTQTYRTLEAIRDERQLQQIVLRLAQASLPAYSQILHGPQEYGKDVVVLLDREERRVLRMFQVKVGNLSMPVWRIARQALEEMFQVPLSEFMLGEEPVDAREGVLVCNGHPLPNVVQPMEGWFEEQRRDHGRQVYLMQLDDLVRWVQDDRLVNELRAVLEELGLKTGV